MKRWGLSKVQSEDITLTGHLLARSKVVVLVQIKTIFPARISKPETCRREAAFYVIREIVLSPVAILPAPIIWWPANATKLSQLSDGVEQASSMFTYSAPCPTNSAVTDSNFVTAPGLGKLSTT